MPSLPLTMSSDGLSISLDSKSNSRLQLPPDWASPVGLLSFSMSSNAGTNHNNPTPAEIDGVRLTVGQQSLMEALKQASQEGGDVVIEIGEDGQPRYRRTPKPLYEYLSTTTYLCHLIPIDICSSNASDYSKINSR
jgi:hypothetical protein